MATNGGTTAHGKHMTEAEAKKRLRQAQRRQQNAKTRKARNLWREKVKLRQHQLRRVEDRRRREAKPHVVHHGGRMRVEGGTLDERILYGARYAHHFARLHYLEGGSYHKGWALLNVPHDDWRSDCSWWYLELLRMCGGHDALDGDAIRFTGSIIEKLREVDAEYARTHVWTAVVFGSGSGFHVGGSVGDGSEEIWQHGTPTFRKGTFGQFGVGTEVRYFTWRPA